MNSITRLPVFALGAESDWEDLRNAMEAAANYQLNQLGKIYPLFLFAALTEPANPDTWEPLKTLPENLLIISIERSMDNRVLNALFRAKFVCGETRKAADCPAVQVDVQRPVAEVYQQMAVAGVRSFAYPSAQADACFFFLRGGAAVKALAKELPNAHR